jgi:hypothetical protein
MTSLKYPVQISPVLSTGYNQTEMVFTTAPEKVDIDDFNHWITPPTELIYNYLILALLPTNPKYQHLAPVKLSAELISFECNLNKKTTTVAIFVKLYQNDKLKSERLYNVTLDVPTKTASAYAITMNNSIAKITQQIVLEINNIK